MMNSQPLVLTTVVTPQKWGTERADVLRVAHAILQEQLSKHGLFTLEQPRETVELFPLSKRVRVSLTVDAISRLRNGGLQRRRDRLDQLDQLEQL
jgi:hypothetical protein